MFISGQCDRIRFAKGGGDLGPPVGFPDLRIHEYSAASGAPAFGPSLPCFCEVRAADTRIRHTVASACVPIHMWSGLRRI